MKLLLDTHVLLWAAGGSPRLPASAKNLIDDVGVRVAVYLTGVVQPRKALEIELASELSRRVLLVVRHFNLVEHGVSIVERGNPSVPMQSGNVAGV